MLKHIPEILSPDLMKAMMEMGHGDELTLGDINFPAVSQSIRYVSARGHTVCELLDAILTFLPLDAYHDTCVTLMDPGEFWNGGEAPIWNSYRKIIKKHDDCGAFQNFDIISSEEFYARARSSFVTVSTSEPSAYGCIILRKGAIV